MEAKEQEVKNAAYALMVMLGGINDELASGNAEPVSHKEIEELYGLATTINEYFENK